MKSNLNRLTVYKPRNDLLSVQREKIIRPLIKAASVEIENLESAYKNMMETWNETAIYFGEESCKPEEFFQAMDQFLQSFQDALLKYSQMKERKQRTSITKSTSGNLKEENSAISLRDQLLQDIRERALQVSLETTAEVVPVKSEFECSECGLSIHQCDCSF